MTIPKLDLEHGFMTYITRNQIDRDNYHKNQLAKSSQKGETPKRTRNESKHPDIATYIAPGMRSKFEVAENANEDLEPRRNTKESGSLRKQTRKSTGVIDPVIPIRRRSLDESGLTTVELNKFTRSLSQRSKSKHPTMQIYRPPLSSPLSSSSKKVVDSSPLTGDEDGSLSAGQIVDEPLTDREERLCKSIEKKVIALYEDKDDEFLFAYNYHGDNMRYSLHIYKETDCLKLAQLFGEEIEISDEKMSSIADALIINRNSLLLNQLNLTSSINS